MYLNLGKALVSSDRSGALRTLLGYPAYQTLGRYMFFRLDWSLCLRLLNAVKTQQLRTFP
jgi:hypothetical protein